MGLPSLLRQLARVPRLPSPVGQVSNLSSLAPDKLKTCPTKFGWPGATGVADQLLNAAAGGGILAPGHLLPELRAPLPPQLGQIVSQSFPVGLLCPEHPGPDLGGRRRGDRVDV